MRTATHADIAAVIKLVSICFEDEINQGMELKTVPQFQALINRSDMFLLVEEENDKIIAIALVQAKTEIRSAQIRVIGVDPSYQGIGVGKRLLNAIIDLAREHDWPKIKIVVPSSNVPARKLMVSFGFIPEGYLRKEFLDEDVILYSYFR
ncbi:MAG: GNAT family N-acetyltransferase [Candidatus Hodarchaeota archaeon]